MIFDACFSLCVGLVPWIAEPSGRLALMKISGRASLSLQNPAKWCFPRTCRVFLPHGVHECLSWVCAPLCFGCWKVWAASVWPTFTHHRAPCAIDFHEPVTPDLTPFLLSFPGTWLHAFVSLSHVLQHATLSVSLFPSERGCCFSLRLDSECGVGGGTDSKSKRNGFKKLM